MNELLTQLSPLAIVAFLVTAMFSLGLDLTVGQIVAPLRNHRLMFRGLLAGLVAPALVAFTLINLVPMDEATQVAEPFPNAAGPIATFLFGANWPVTGSNGSGK